MLENGAGAIDTRTGLNYTLLCCAFIGTAYWRARNAIPSDTQYTRYAVLIEYSFNRKEGDSVLGDISEIYFFRARSVRGDL